MECAFCEIAEGTRDALVVHDDADTVAFLDRRPVFHGHTLVIPRVHHETILDLPPDAIEPVFRAVQRVTAAVVAAMNADGAFVAQNNRISQSVPHLHVHVVPRRAKDGLKGFFWPRHPYSSDEEAAEVATRIRAQLTSSPLGERFGLAGEGPEKGEPRQGA